ncbi:LysR family transcriptional regulator [Cupriavidus sp. D39]|uniref:LysR family transcriptional regulator n=1 Tax=Cupriavidus sp. D39 TaxID=2997877 RepID=UPI00226D6B06|nr:LysR family transcriptional regulator [Cupriavidus sp. D39]MCY0853616.1 LysR family transcriptional regulator [Cupriavidus sp. D39]
MNQLVVLDAILAERSVRRAADRVFLSQPAMSNALARLRDYFDDELVQQIGKHLVLTPLGESLVKPVRDVLLQVQAITTTRPNFDPSTSTRRITIEASDYVMNVFLADVLQLAWKEAPNMQFDLRLISTQSHENLDSGEVEMLLAPEFFASKNHPSEILFSDTFSCVVWNGNPEIASRLTRDKYMAMGHVAVQWGSGQLVSAEEEFMAKHGFLRRRELVAPSFTVLPRLIVGTNRIATIQTRLANAMSEIYPMRVLPCPVPTPQIVEMVQWHRYQERDPAITWFRGLLMRVAQSFGTTSIAASQRSGKRKAAPPKDH